jgi:hypothetical protein
MNLCQPSHQVGNLAYGAGSRTVRYRPDGWPGGNGPTRPTCSPSRIPALRIDPGDEEALWEALRLVQWCCATWATARWVESGQKALAMPSAAPVAASAERASITFS